MADYDTTVIQTFPSLCAIQVYLTYNLEVLILMMMMMMNCAVLTHTQHYEAEQNYTSVYCANSALEFELG